MTQSQSTLKVGEKQRDAAKSEKMSVTKGEGAKFGRKKAVPRLTQLMNEPLLTFSTLWPFGVEPQAFLHANVFVAVEPKGDETLKT